MKKLLISSAVSAMFALGAIAPAMATPPTVNLTNIGSISNTIATSASTNLGAPSSSYSSATGIASAVSNGQTSFSNPSTPTSAGANITASGQVTTANSGNAFNISTGNGTGAASTNGSSNASLDAFGTYGSQASPVSAGIGNGYGSEQQLTVEGSIGQPLNSGNGIGGGQGTNIGVNATTNGGGAIVASTAGTFTVNGSVGATTAFDGTTTSVNVAGQVNDTKTSISSVAATNVLNVGTGTNADGSSIITSTLPGNVTGSANADNSVNVAGSFNDPALAVAQ